MTTERPILMSGPMVRAILEGRKSQTRRVVSPLPEQFTPRGLAMLKCPYGAPGDRLWVRETCRAHELTDKEAEDDAFGAYTASDEERPPYGLDGVVYKADNTFKPIENSLAASELWGHMHNYRGKRGATVPPIHMPRWASRLVLEVTAVRVERLQDISAEDVLSEGITDRWSRGNEAWSAEQCDEARAEYRVLWDSLNAKRAPWASNPWVWVIEFHRTK